MKIIRRRDLLCKTGCRAVDSPVRRLYRWTGRKALSGAMVADLVDAPACLCRWADEPMSETGMSWDHRVAALWAAMDSYDPEAFVEKIERLAAELPSGDALGLFERASAHDSTGHPDVAVPLYRAALQAGLTGLRRREATIQLASSLRNLGKPADSAVLLSEELHASSDELDGAVRAFLALALVDLGREREAVAISLAALSKYLPQYNRSLARYASDLAPGLMGMDGPSKA